MNRARYTPIREIGRGAYGVVDETRDSVGQPKMVALKRLHDLAQPNAQNRDRFKREVRLLQKLQHPGIVEVLDADLVDDNPWFTMPLAEKNLADEIVPGLGVDDDRIREIFDQLLDALSYAHKQGVIHRDLKPQNILIFHGKVIISDFGLGRQLDSVSATLTVTGDMGGTFGYVAPEQWMDLHQVDARADVYVLGSLLFQMATGTNPVALNSRTLPDRYGHIVSRCRAHDPDERYSSVEELREEFDRLWATDFDLTSPLDRATTHLKGAATDSEKRRKLVDLYLQCPSDEDLYTQTIPHWSDELLEVLVDEGPEGLAAILGVFDRHVEGLLQFEFVDTVCRFLEQVYHASQDQELRRLALTRILRMGERHNRFHAGRAFSRLAHAAREPTDVLALRGVLFANPDAAKWVAEWLRSETISPIIRDAIAILTGDRPPLALPTGRPIPSVAAATVGPRYMPAQRVLHGKFGQGVVVEVKARGSDQEVLVDFGRHGPKRLLASLAFLEVQS